MNNQNNDIDIDIDALGEIVDNIIKESDIRLMIEMPEGTTETKITGIASAFPTIKLYILLIAVAQTIERIWKTKDGDGRLIFKQDKMEEFADEALEMVKGYIRERAEERHKNQTDLD